MGSGTGMLVDYEAIIASDYGHSTTRDLTLNLTLQGGGLYPLLGEGFSLGDTLRIVQCDGEEKETDVFERMIELQLEAEYALDATRAVTIWHAGGYWCAREMKNDDTRFMGRGPTPIAALEDLLAIARKRQVPRPHEEEWSIEQCIEWLEERGEISTRTEPRTAYFWEKGSFQNSRRLIAKASSLLSWIDAYRNLVVTVNEKQQEAE